MSDRFITGIAGTGRTPIHRQHSIPLLSRALGPYEFWHQQGEDERPEWVLERLRELWRQPGMNTNGRSFQNGYKDVPEVSFSGDTLPNLDRIMSIRHEFERAADVLDRLYKGHRWERGLLAGFAMPTIDLASFAFPTRPDLADKFGQQFADATRRDILAVYASLQDNMTLCLESPASLTNVHATPAKDRALVAQRFGQQFAAFAMTLPPRLQQRLVLHLCRGDLGHKSWFGGIDSLEPLVTLANAIRNAFAARGLPIPTMFLPTCAGDVLPSLEESFFSPLSNLAQDIPVILANLHEICSLKRGVSLNEAFEHNLTSCRLAARALTLRNRRPGFQESVILSLSCGARMEPSEWTFLLRTVQHMLNTAGTLGPVDSQ